MLQEEQHVDAHAAAAVSLASRHTFRRLPRQADGSDVAVGDVSQDPAPEVLDESFQPNPTGDSTGAGGATGSVENPLAQATGDRTAAVPASLLG